MMNPNRSARRPSYSTMTTIKAIIAVIALIAGCAVMFLPDALRQSRSKACHSNMKDIGYAFGHYLEDYDGTYPTYGGDKSTITGRPPDPQPPGAAGGPPRSNWHAALRPYLRDDKVLRCPSDDSEVKKGYASSYTANGWSEYDLKEADVLRPEKWILLAERNNAERNNKTNAPDAPWLFYWWTWQGTSPRVWPPAALPDPTAKAAEDLALAPHDGGGPGGEMSFALYGDGHVGGMRARTFRLFWRSGAENPFWPGPPRE